MAVTPATTLLQGLEAKLDGDPAVSAAFAASGGVWLAGVPEDINTLPFLAVVHHDEVPDLNGPPGIVDEIGSFDIVIRGVQPLSGVEALAGLVKALLDPIPSRDPGGRVELTIQGVALCYVERLGYRVKRLPRRAAAGPYLYEITMPFRSFLTRHATQ